MTGTLLGPVVPLYRIPLTVTASSVGADSISNVESALRYPVRSTVMVQSSLLP